MTQNDRPPPKDAPSGLIGKLAVAVALIWILGAAAAAVALIGPEQVGSLRAVELAALAAAIVLPAAMTWFAGAAARESARARVEARRLADAADRLLNPEQSAGDAARRLALGVRQEIATLDQALERTLERLQHVEGQIARQAQAVDTIAEQAKAGANQMISGMEREREELLRISRDLTQQAHTIGDSISRHTHAISEAARKAEAEVRAADQALDHRLTSFGAAAALINDRTTGLTSAAQTSADSALRLESALSNALDVLSKATNLTDAARQSAEAATLAANSTAGAVRDTTARAVDDAKRAADLIRGEAAAVEREAALALERLRDAAEAARHAAIGARAAAEAPPPQARAGDAHTYDRSWRDQRDPLEQTSTRAEQSAPPRQPASSDWTWRSLLSSVDEGETRRPQPRRDASAPLPSGLSQMLLNAGVDPERTFSASALDRIAQRARSGTQARRRAVVDAAPEAAQRLRRAFAEDTHANQEAMQFLRQEGQRIAELLGRGRAAMGAEATRAFLLIDAAVG